jgi:hypothetical protein
MKTFNQYLGEYRDSLVGTGTSLQEASFLFWLKNFVNQPEPMNPAELITGKIYSFEYFDTLTKEKKFINKRPIVFFTENKKETTRDLIKGIDLILMPPGLRISLLEQIFSVYQEQIKRNMESRNTRDQIPLKTDFSVINEIFYGMPFKNSFRSWDIKKIRDIKEISYENWAKIPYLLTRSIEGMPIEEIYKKYNK